MPPPWASVAECRIVGEMHGQQTVNVFHLATNTVVADPPALNALLDQLAAAMLECAIDALLPAVTLDWKLVQCDAKTLSPAVSDPVIATAPADSVGVRGVTNVSFAASLINMRTGIGGRRGRGRKFLPPAGDADIAQSAVDNDVLVLLAAFAACVAGKFMGAGKTTDWDLGILSRTDLHAAGGTFDNSFRIVTQLSAKADVAVLRSRKKGHGS